MDHSRPDGPVFLLRWVPRSQPSFRGRVLAITTIDEPPETVFLGGQAFRYSDQNWVEFLDVAVAAYTETRQRLFIYWGHLCSGSPIIEDGLPMKPDVLLYRCIELIGGLNRLRIFAEIVPLH